MRLFFALFPPRSRELDSLYEGLGRTGNNLKRVAPENMHFTVKFLGEVPQRLSDISRVAESVISEYDPFEMKYRDAGAFPSWRRPAVIWLGVENGELLEDMARDLDLKLNEEIMIKKEKRPFRAHMTVARVKRGKRVDAKSIRKEMDRSIDKLTSDEEAIPVRSIHLCSSTLTPEGPIYERVREFRLKDR